MLGSDKMESAKGKSTNFLFDIANVAILLYLLWVLFIAKI